MFTRFGGTYCPRNVDKTFTIRCKKARTFIQPTDYSRVKVRMGADTCFGLQVNRPLLFPSYNQNWIGLKNVELPDIKYYENLLPEALQLFLVIRFTKRKEKTYFLNQINVHRGADNSLTRPGRKQATATEDFDVHISYL